MIFVFRYGKCLHLKSANNVRLESCFGETWCQTCWIFMYNCIYIAVKLVFKEINKKSGGTQMYKVSQNRQATHNSEIFMFTHGSLIKWILSSRCCLKLMAPLFSNFFDMPCMHEVFKNRLKNGTTQFSHP